MNTKDSVINSEDIYWAFISYRHSDNRETDREWATWLHREIEQYEVPAELIGTTNMRGDIIPERIYPVFRDEESLPANADLTTSISEALDRAKFLVTLCSPGAVESRYVAQEIQHFKDAGKSDRIVAALISGEPGHPINECFPAPLREIATVDGKLFEPIAADFRQSDGNEGYTSSQVFRKKLLSELPKKTARKMSEQYEQRLQLMKLKVISGILGLPLEKLRDRDQVFQLSKARTKQRILSIIIATIATLGIITGISGIIAWQQKMQATARSIEARTQEKLAKKSASYSLLQVASQHLENNLPYSAISAATEAVKIDENCDTALDIIETLRKNGEVSIATHKSRPGLLIDYDSTINDSISAISNDGRLILYESNDYEKMIYNTLTQHSFSADKGETKEQEEAIKKITAEYAQANQFDRFDPNKTFVTKSRDTTLFLEVAPPNKGEFSWRNIFKKYVNAKSKEESYPELIPVDDYIKSIYYLDATQKWILIKYYVQASPEDGTYSNIINSRTNLPAGLPRLQDSNDLIGLALSLNKKHLVISRQDAGFNIYDLNLVQTENREIVLPFKVDGIFSDDQGIGVIKLNLEQLSAPTGAKINFLRIDKNGNLNSQPLKMNPIQMSKINCYAANRGDKLSNFFHPWTTAQEEIQSIRKRQNLSKKINQSAAEEESKVILKDIKKTTSQIPYFEHLVSSSRIAVIESTEDLRTPQRPCVRIIDTESKNDIREPIIRRRRTGSYLPVKMICTDNNSTRILVVWTDDTGRIYDLETGLATSGLFGEIDSACFGPNTNKLYILTKYNTIREHTIGSTSSRRELILYSNRLLEN